MRKREAPRVALWLLDHLGSPSVRTEITGDLLERYDRQSRRWFWIQTLWAIGTGASHEVRAHKWLSLQVVATAFVTYIVASSMFGALIAMSGRVVMAPYIFFVLVGTSHLCAGWVTGRLHRHAHGTVLMLLVSVALLWNLPDSLRLVSAAATHDRYLPYLIAQLQRTGVACAAIFIGGLLSAPPRRRLVA